MAGVLLAPSWYASEDVVEKAVQLLGKYVVTKFKGQITTGKIVETEAYRAPEDKASHAFQNRRTARTEVMFQQGGIAYVYLCYGIHHLFNVVTGPEGVAHAVLVRAVEPISGIKEMQQRRAIANRYSLSSGPGKLTQALGIIRGHSGLPLWRRDSLITIEDHFEDVPECNILAGPRVGIDYAEEWVDKPWRFRIKDNPYVSTAK